jgi:hypothetical protein
MKLSVGMVLNVTANINVATTPHCLNTYIHTPTTHKVATSRSHNY